MINNAYISPKCDCCNDDVTITIDTDDGLVTYSPVCFKFRQKLVKKQIEKYTIKVKDVLEELNKNNDK